jgi:MFS family permease
VGTLIMALGLALIPFPKTFLGEFPVMMLLAFGNSIAGPILTALVSELAPEHERGEVIGVYQSVSSLGRIIGPNVGGTFFTTVSAGAPYIAGACIMLFSFLLALKLVRTCPHIAVEDANLQTAAASG